ncbi:type VI secretion system protein ImpA [Paucimonas lemoignei]|uniref:Type VI secretion system protein ImpA n=2 Tax=Paucimonas lemoignei TaxID=29443 RepID=A0A4R3I3Q4_PAULE|nr:type VI secretion system protein ImpA [Paucimonas lemoignei]
MQFEGILEPISESSLCGEDLAYSPEFDRIKEARREDDPSIEYGEWQAELKQADWPAVVKDCTQLLATRSKDLRLAAWLTEGLVKTDGLAGLGQGMELAARLIERFGGQIHPQPERGDQEQRIGNISWLVKRMAELVRQIPVTQSKLGAFNLNDFESARMVESQLQRDPESIAEDKITLEKFSAAAAKTDQALFKQWLSDAVRCQAALGELKRVADALFGDDGPTFAPLSESLDAIQDRLQRTARELGLLEEGEKNTSVDEDETTTVDALAQCGGPKGPIRTRAQALEQLRLVADFFRRTEPHSPVAYLADKAARWGNMPLHVWLRSVMKDQGSLSHLEELLGMDREASES